MVLILLSLKYIDPLINQSAHLSPPAQGVARQILKNKEQQKGAAVVHLCVFLNGMKFELCQSLLFQ